MQSSPELLGGGGVQKVEQRSPPMGSVHGGFTYSPALQRKLIKSQNPTEKIPNS